MPATSAEKAYATANRLVRAWGLPRQDLDEWHRREGTGTSGEGEEFRSYLNDAHPTLFLEIRPYSTDRERWYLSIGAYWG
ncbi:MAG: hypothetical protein M3P51_00535 [Chloroflexota bacterium]|nr:hypothetical protein [Chloroflexota bacterium]